MWKCSRCVWSFEELWNVIVICEYNGDVVDMYGDGFNQRKESVVVERRERGIKKGG
jgi:hypothetical protein